jgi:hypothetical protein
MEPPCRRFLQIRELKAQSTLAAASTVPDHIDGRLWTAQERTAKCIDMHGTTEGAAIGS